MEELPVLVLEELPVSVLVEFPVLVLVELPVSVLEELPAEFRASLLFRLDDPLDVVLLSRFLLVAIGYRV